MSNPSRKTTCRSGHTLIELMTAVLIIGIISATAIPFYMSSVRRSNDQTQNIRLMLVRDAIEQYVAENDRQLPPANSELEFKKVIGNLSSISFAADKSLDKVLNSESNLFLNAFVKIMR